MGLLLAWPLATPTAQPLESPQPTGFQSELLTFESLAGFKAVPPDQPGELTFVSSEITPRRPWDQLIASWNVASNVPLHLEVRARFGDRYSRYFSLGHWSLATNEFPRASVNGQNDPDGDVQTDTLVLAQPASALQLRVHFPGATNALPSVRFLALSLLDSKHPTKPASPTPPPPAPHLIDVPLRSQADYPEGITQWCSPTSLTMVLAHHGQALRRPDLQHDVRQVAHAVFDPSWPGTGNWSFNVAFAGTQPGLRAFAARLPDFDTLEAWIRRDIPVITSVSLALLRGKPYPEKGDGHLIVVVGFDSNGDVVINDPGVRMDRVRQTVPLATFLRAWAYSKNTVYLVYPEASVKLDPLTLRPKT